MTKLVRYVVAPGRRHHHPGLPDQRAHPDQTLRPKITKRAQVRNHHRRIGSAQNGYAPAKATAARCSGSSQAGQAYHLTAPVRLISAPRSPIEVRPARFSSRGITWGAAAWSTAVGRTGGPLTMISARSSQIALSAPRWRPSGASSSRQAGGASGPVPRSARTCRPGARSRGRPRRSRQAKLRALYPANRIWAVPAAMAPRRASARALTSDPGHPQTSSAGAKVPQPRSFSSCGGLSRLRR